MPFIYQIQVKAHTPRRYIAYMYALRSLIQPDFKRFKQRNGSFRTLGKLAIKECRMINVEIGINSYWRVDVETAACSCGLREATPRK